MLSHNKALAYGPPRLISSEEWYCPKCGNVIVQTRYNKKKDIMEIYCGDCGYEYTGPTWEQIKKEQIT